MRVLALIACAWMLGAAAPSQTTPSVPASSKPQSAPQTAPAPTKAETRGKDGLTAYERESLAVDRAANRIAERANLIADDQRSYALWQMIIGFAGVGFTGVAAFWAWRATHWAKQASFHAQGAAGAARDQLEAMRDVEAGALAAIQTATVENGTLWIDFQNAGRSPVVATEVLYTLRDDLPPGPMAERDFHRKESNFVIVPGAHIGLIDVTGSLSFRHVLGVVRYLDIYGRRMILPFRFDRNNANQWVAKGGEALSFAENILSESDGAH